MKKPRRGLRAAFVMTFSALGAVGCHKDNPGACEPPDCHANPPPLPERPDAAKAPEIVAADASSTPIPTTSDLYSKVMNPRDPKTTKTIHATGDGHCVIFPDPPKGTPPPTSLVAPTSQPIACPEAMKDGPFKQCAYGTVMARADDSACVCAAVFGNPPAPPTSISCPRK
jgi:hypothetical protein